MRKIELNKEQINALKEKYESGISTLKLANEYGISKPTINKILRENNVIIRKDGRYFVGGKSEADKRYYKKNKEKRLNYFKKWAKENRDDLREYHSEWRDKNRENLRKRAREYDKRKRGTDPFYKFSQNIRTAIWQSLKDRTDTKYVGVLRNMNFSIDELINHIEKQFTEQMVWGNYGEWHVDHIKPISLFYFTSYDDAQFKECWDLSNLRPMWATTRVINGVMEQNYIRMSLQRIVGYIKNSNIQRLFTHVICM